MGFSLFQNHHLMAIHFLHRKRYNPILPGEWNLHFLGSEVNAFYGFGEAPSDIYAIDRRDILDDLHTAAALHGDCIEESRACCTILLEIRAPWSAYSENICQPI